MVVTGGAGFIGSNLVNDLLGRRREVTMIDDLTSGYRENLSPIRDSASSRATSATRAVDGRSTGRRRSFISRRRSGTSAPSIDPIHDAEINVIGTLQRARGGAAGRRAQESSSRPPPGSSAS